MLWNTWNVLVGDNSDDLGRTMKRAILWVASCVHWDGTIHNQYRMFNRCDRQECVTTRDSLWFENERVSMITSNNSWQITLTVTWLVLQLAGRDLFKRRLKATHQKVKKYNAFSYSTMITLSWSSAEELRCLFVREGWSEYCLWWWRHSCSGMPMLRGSQWRDLAYLNITSRGWESLSRVMWWGCMNVKLCKP